MKKTILMATVGCICLLSGCSDWTQGQAKKVQALKPPVVVVANGPEGGVLLRGADGCLYLAQHDTYLGRALKNTKSGEVIVPAR